MGEFVSSDVRKFVLLWNSRFPLDLWWRRKYNVPFGSKQHRQMSFVDMRIEYEEHILIEEEKKNRSTETSLFSESPKQLDSIINSKDVAAPQVQTMSQNEIDAEFSDPDFIKKYGGHQKDNNT